MSKRLVAAVCAAGFMGGLSGWAGRPSAHAEVVSSQGAKPAAQVKASLFDPTKHMRVSEVRKGMKGYGLTVFQGTKIERFEVEVIDTVRNFGPGFDAVLIMAKGEYLEHTGSIAGMSGSPIYLTDDDGKSRLIGAFAFGWGMAKDPIAGVQPIEYMLDFADPKLQRESVAGGPEVKVEGRRSTWNIYNVAPLPGRAAPKSYPLVSRSRWEVNPLFARGKNSGSGFGNGSMTALSVSSSGLSRDIVAAWTPLLEAYGMRSVQVGGGGGSAVANPAEVAEIVPGSSLVVPVMTGDVELSAVGTCTEVIGDRVFGFGHPFNGEGGVELPMGAGHINTVVAMLSSSFKQGAFTKELGVLRADTAVGVAGTFGGQARTIPVTVRVVYEDGSVDRTMRFRIARHPRFTALLSVLSAQAALSGVHELPNQFTLQYDCVMRFEGEKDEVRVANRLANGNPAEMFFGMATPVMAAVENPFGRSYPESIETTMRVSAGARVAEIIGVRADKTTYKPGETVRLFASSRVLRGGIESKTLELSLPADLDPGEYTVVVSDAARFQVDDAEQRPNLYFADSLPTVFRAVRRVGSFRSDKYYVRLSRDATGVSVGTVALSKLPGSRQRLLSKSAGELGVGAVASPLTNSIDAGRVVSGAAEVTITVTGEAGRKPRPTINPPAAPSFPGLPRPPGRADVQFPE